MSKRLKTCVIGMGPIGNLHGDLLKTEALADLAGVCDRLPERAETAGRRLGVPWYLRTEEMLASVQPDVCVVATGGHEYASDHRDPTLEALRAGCHVLCEKPISNEIAAAEEMVRTAADLRRCFGIDFNHRFTPAARLARRWLDEGRLGDLLFVNVALWIGKLGEFDSPYFHLKALNPHSIDLIRHFCGEIVQAHCFATRAPGRTLWSTASINLKLANGAVGHLTSSYDIERGHPMERCEVAGTKGRFVLDDMWREATLFPAGEPVKSVYTNPVFGGFQGFEDTFRDRVHTFLAQVAAGEAPEAIDGSGADGLAAQRVIAAAIESLETGRTVSIEY